MTGFIRENGSTPYLVVMGDKRISTEIEIIESFMPKQLSDAETAAAVEAVVKETGAASIKDMGRVMGELKKRHAGQMDFAKAGAIVKEKLG